MKATARIFLSYARENEQKVEKLYRKLYAAGFKPWMDTKDILPGEQWEPRVPQAIRHSDFFLACLSTNSVNKRGFLQKEIKEALDIWQEMLDSDIYLIPVRLEDCEVPESLRDFQWVDLFEESGWTRLVKAIQVGMEHRAEVSVDEEPSYGMEMVTPKEGSEQVYTIFSSAFAEFVRRQAGAEPTSRIQASTSIPKEITLKPSEPRMCQLSITCNKHGRVSVRIAGSLSYEGDSGRALGQSLVDRMDRRAIGALRLPDWRFQVKEIGRELFDELVLNRPEIEKGYQRAVGHVQQAAFSLALHAPRYFMRLPFEALHSEDEGNLCLKYPMYRVVSGCFFDKEPLSTALISQLDSQGERPRALVVASNTWNTRTSPIPGVEEEVRKVSALLRKHGFDVCSLSTDEATEKRVRDELTGGGYLLFHYAGHGAYSPDSPEKGALYFWEGTKGKSKVIKLIASQLESLVQNTPLRFVYLSSCWGAHTAPPAALLDDDFLGVMDGLVTSGVPVVLGFRWPVSDDGAQLLAQSFYSAWLDEEKKLDKALYEARRTVADQFGRDERAWFSPILAMRAPGF